MLDFLWLDKLAACAQMELFMILQPEVVQMVRIAQG